MAKYKVMIEETFRRIVEVDAENYVDAQWLVEDMYQDQEIVLSGENDFYEYNLYLVA